MALTLRQRVVPARCEDPRNARILRSLCGYVAVYYALWAGSDLLILYGGIDAGWLLRALPNQLYYAFWVPAVYYSFRSRG